MLAALLTACALVTGLSGYDVGDATNPDGSNGSSGSGTTSSGSPGDAAAKEGGLTGDTGTRPIDASADTTNPAGRVTTGLLALYTFKEGGGRTVHDVSGVVPALDLTLDDLSDAGFVGNGLTIVSPTYVASPSAATKIITACKASNEITIETWVTPASTTSTIARVAGIAAGYGDLDFTLDTTTSRFDSAMRTAVAANVDDQLISPVNTVMMTPIHAVAMYLKTGSHVLYVDGVEIATDLPDADLSVWDNTHPMTLGNGSTNDLAWLGTIHLVAVYGRALTPAEIMQNFKLRY